MGNRPTSVIEVLSSGFELVASRWHLFLIPLLLDVILLFGPRVDLTPILSEVSQTIYTALHERIALPDEAEFHQLVLGAAGGGEARHLLNVGTPSILGANLQFATLARTDPDAWLAGTQPFQVADPFVWSHIGVPSLLVGRTAVDPPMDIEPLTIRVTTVPELFALIGGTYIIGFLFGTTYMMLIAAQVTLQPGRIMLAKLPRYVLRLAGVLLGALVLNGLVGFPFWLLAGLVSLQSISLALFTLALGFIVMAWCLLFIAFAGHGVLLHERSPLPALWDSVRVVQWYLPATIIMMILVLAIDFTLTQIWLVFSTGWMIVPGLIGHAIVSAALLSAMFIYYDERYQHWSEARARLLKELRRQRTQNAQ